MLTGNEKNDLPQMRHTLDQSYILYLIWHKREATEAHSSMHVQDEIDAAIKKTSDGMGEWKNKDLFHAVFAKFKMGFAL